MHNYRRFCKAYRSFIREGIKYAIKSAKIASEIIADSLNRNIILDEKYTQSIENKLISELKLARQMALLVYNFPEVAYNGLIRVSHDTARILNGQLSYSDFIKRLKKKLLKTVLKKFGITLE
jgi:flavin-dependent dehydrogenase